MMPPPAPQPEAQVHEQRIIPHVLIPQTEQHPSQMPPQVQPQVQPQMQPQPQAQPQPQPHTAASDYRKTTFTFPRNSIRNSKDHSTSTSRD